MKIRKIKEYIKKICKRNRLRCEYDYVVYDSQDNIVKINNGEWEQSWDLVSMEGLNTIFSVRHDWTYSRIKIGSSIHNTITKVFVNGRLAELEKIGDYWYASYPDLQVYMNNTDVFYLHIKTY